MTSLDTWQTQVTEQIEAVIREQIAATTETWRTGRLSPRLDVLTDDFQATQYAPWYEGGAWSGDRQAWLDGTAEAAKNYAGQGIRWEVSDIVVLPRSPEEAAVMYQVWHIWPEADRPPARALFLETWVKRDGRWLLRRHTAEKAPGRG